jgi:hypothetical protein
VFRTDTRPHARMQVVAHACWGGSARVKAIVAMVIGEAVSAGGRWCSGVPWPELIVEVDYGGRSR